MKRTSFLIGLAITSLLLTAPTTLAASPAPSMGHEHAGLPSLSSPAAELRVTLDRLFAEHAFLTIEQMRSGLTDAPDFAAAARAVEANSTDVADAIGSVYGEAAVEPFGEIWRSHIGYLVDYAVSLGKDDATGRDAALDGLAVYRHRIADFLTAANPGVDLGGITDALDMHTAQLVAFVDAEHAGDHAKAYAIERDAYPHMFHVGDALAKVIAHRFPDTFTGVDLAYSAAGTLRVTLDRILAEHAFLAAEVMRSGVSKDPAFGAGKKAVAGNSKDLQDLIGAAYGGAAGSSFRDLWDSHIEAYLGYIEGAQANDATAKAGAKSQIDVYVGQLAGFLAGANPKLDAAALTAMFQAHAGHLLSQVDAFTAADYDMTFQLVRTGYEHMFDTGEALAMGIAAQLPGKFPADAAAPATDTDAHPGHVPAGDVAVPLLLVTILGIAVLAALARGRLLRAYRHRG